MMRLLSDQELYTVSGGRANKETSEPSTPAAISDSNFDNTDIDVIDNDDDGSMYAMQSSNQGQPQVEIGINPGNATASVRVFNTGASLGSGPIAVSVAI